LLIVTINLNLGIYYQGRIVIVIESSTMISSHGIKSAFIKYQRLLHQTILLKILNN